MKQLFVVNAAADLQVSIGGASAAGYASLTAGAKGVSFRANGNSSIDLDGKEGISISTINYSAGTSQVATVVLGAGTYVKVINTTIGTANLPMRTFVGTAAQIAAAITAADGDFAAYSAVNVSGTITVTAEVNSSFRLATDGGAIAYTVVGVPSTGEGADVEALWEACLPALGITNKTGFPVIKPASPVVAATNYDLIVVDLAPAASNKAVAGLKHEHVKLIFAVNSADAVASNDGSGPIATELAAWIA